MQLGRGPSLALGMTVGLLGMQSASSLRNPDRLDVGKLSNPFGAKFAAVTGSFDPAEWHARIGRDHRIYEHHSAFQFVRKEFLLGRLVCPNAGAEPKCGIVCNRDRFLAIVRAKEQRDWAENFLAVSRRALGNFRQHRWLVKIAHTVSTFSAA